MKKILVLPVKNEDWILPYSLACASLWADRIIIADQNSTDRSPEIYRRFPKVTVIKNSNQFHSSNVRKQLLGAARELDGNNAIFSFDADEIPTAEILNSEFWHKVEQLPPGSLVELLWVNLWRSTARYRTDGVQAPAYKQVGFIDDRTTEYTTLNVINDHTSRVPLIANGKSYRFETPKILHYQFANWERTISKQAHYRMTEWLQKDKTWLNALKINLKYFPTKDERGLTLKAVSANWTEDYRVKGIELNEFSAGQLSWHDVEALKYFQEYQPEFFSRLDVWDIDWEGKRQQAKKAGMPVGDRPIVIPKMTLGGAMLKFLSPILSYRNWATKLYGSVAK